jgi:hypothetical protein
MSTRKVEGPWGEDAELEAVQCVGAGRGNITIASSLGPCRAALVASLLVASAGCYTSLGVGGGPALHGNLRTAALGEGDGANGRLAAGISIGRLSIETSVSRFGLDSDTATALGEHVRLRFPIKGGFDAFGRIGLEWAWLGDLPQATSMPDLQQLHTGKVGALGVEYLLSAPLLGKAGFWAEASVDHLDMGGHTRNILLWTTGVMLGL